MLKWCIVLLSFILSQAVVADEIHIGDDNEINGMNVGAVYLQAVMMAPMHEDHKVDADIHLEADISALASNVNGFEEGAWMPYLTVSYILTKKDSDWVQKGEFVPMVANDGPHYGKNIKMDGAGEYSVTYTINNPSTNGFYYHIDKETGIEEWWSAFDLSWDFTYVGVGKKGGY